MGIETPHAILATVPAVAVQAGIAHPHSRFGRVDDGVVHSRERLTAAGSAASQQSLIEAGVHR
jgi:hypothetical protein